VHPSFDKRFFLTWARFEVFRARYRKYIPKLLHNRVREPRCRGAASEALRVSPLYGVAAARMWREGSWIADQ
jgi:hypothetical protein